jgi:hypothetical protein
LQDFLQTLFSVFFHGANLRVLHVPEIDYIEAARKGFKDDIWAIRGQAIQAYANLEQSLVRLFASLSDMKIGVAQIVFFKISNSDSRNKIIETLFKRKFETNYNLFRNSLVSHLRPIDIERNQIVHWNVVIQVGLDENGGTTSEATLMPPALVSAGLNPPVMYKTDLQDFIAKCIFYIYLINAFYREVLDPDPPHPDATPSTEAEKQTWRDIFSQPIIYPPPAAHPLSRIEREPDSPHQAFELLPLFWNRQN